MYIFQFYVLPKMSSRTPVKIIDLNELHATERVDKLYSYSVRKSLSITAWFSVKMNILAPGIRAFQICPKNGNFMKRWPIDFD
jgi:hypothetical protein